MKTKVLSVLYFMTGILCIAFENRVSFYPELGIKALLIPLLIVIFILNSRQTFKRLSIIMLAGLFFSWAGDITLEFSFIPGLICFLLAHIMYLSVFFLTPGENFILRHRLYMIIPVALYGVGLLSFLYNDLGEMKLPVTLYALVILSMLFAAINRLRKVNSLSYWLVLTGAVLFVLSDSAIAVNKFTGTFKYSGIVIMSTYVIAQYLIVTGFIRQNSGEMV